MTFLVPKFSFAVLSRVLIMFAATGGGEYWGEFGKNSLHKQTRCLYCP